MLGFFISAFSLALTGLPSPWLLLGWSSSAGWPAPAAWRGRAENGWIGERQSGLEGAWVGVLGANGYLRATWIEWDGDPIRYMLKYLRKSDKEYQHVVPAGYINVGRWWGIRNMRPAWEMLQLTHPRTSLRCVVCFAGGGERAPGFRGGSCSFGRERLEMVCGCSPCGTAGMSYANSWRGLSSALADQRALEAIPDSRTDHKIGHRTCSLFIRQDRLGAHGCGHGYHPRSVLPWCVLRFPAVFRTPPARRLRLDPLAFQAHHFLGRIIACPRKRRKFVDFMGKAAYGLYTARTRAPRLRTWW